MKKYWLTGGFIGVAYFLFTLFLTHDDSYSEYPEGCNIFLVLLNPWGILLADVEPFNVFWRDNLVSNSCESDIIMLTRLLIPANFIIGSVIGWLYGKFKKRKVGETLR